MFLYFLERLRAKRKKFFLWAWRAPASINYDHTSNKQIYAVTIRPVQLKSVLYKFTKYKAARCTLRLPTVIQPLHLAFQRGQIHIRRKLM